MGLGNKTSKLGNMMAVDLNSISHKPDEAPQQVKEIVEQPQVQEPVKKQSKKQKTEEPPIIMGRPKFELIAGMPEKKVNFHCPEDLFWAINNEASKQHITNKQLICEMLLEVMTKKYGFKVK